MHPVTCVHGTSLNTIEEGTAHARGVLLCTGLTGNITPSSTSGALATALTESGWRSIRFDYCGSLDPAERSDLRTMERMREDIQSVIDAVPPSFATTIVARGRAAQPALRVAATSPRVQHVVLWAPIVWVDAPHSTLKAEILRDVERDGYAMIDGTRVGKDFLYALDDPTDADVASWARRGCVYSIVHPSGDEVHALHLAERLADILRANGGVVRFTKVPGLHTNIQRIPHEQIIAVVSALG